MARRHGQWELQCDRKPGGYVFGAFVPATGEAMSTTCEPRSIVTFVDFLEKVEEWAPDGIGRIYAIMDNLRAHKAYDVPLFDVSHPSSIRVYMASGAMFHFMYVTHVLNVEQSNRCAKCMCHVRSILDGFVVDNLQPPPPTGGINAFRVRVSLSQGQEEKKG